MDRNIIILDMVINWWLIEWFFVNEIFGCFLFKKLVLVYILELVVDRALVVINLKDFFFCIDKALV